MGKYSNKVNKKHRRNVTFKKYGGGQLSPEQQNELKMRADEFTKRQALNKGVVQESSLPPQTSSIPTSDPQPTLTSDPQPTPTSDSQPTTPTLPNTPNEVLTNVLDRNNKDTSTSTPDNSSINPNAVIQSTEQIPASNVSSQNIFDVTTVGNLDADTKKMLLQSESTPIPDETNVYKIDFTKIMSNKFVLSINGKYLVINKKIQNPTPVVP